MTRQEQAEELCFHNKIIDQQLADLAAQEMDMEMLRLRSMMAKARILEASNMEIEMFMKRGEPESEANDEVETGWSADHGGVMDVANTRDQDLAADGW